MSLTTHELGFEALDQIAQVDALCVFVSEDERPLRGAAGLVDWRLCGRLSRVLEDGFFTGTKDDALLLPTDGQLYVPRVFAVGLGKLRGLDQAGLRQAFKTAANTLTRAKMSKVAIDVPSVQSLSDEARANAVRESFLTAYQGEVALFCDKGLARLIKG